MRLEVLVEDQSGQKMLEILIPKIVGDEHTFRVHAYKGIGNIPKNVDKIPTAKNRLLLNNLSRLLKGHGKTFLQSGNYQKCCVVVVCDLDEKCLKEFRRQLLQVLNRCTHKPRTQFCIAIKESEAWFLGDTPAVKSAYPRARDRVLDKFQRDFISGTWDSLADAVFPGGARKLQNQGWQAIGAEKMKWAEKITPYMKVDDNKSSSFCYFRDKMRQILQTSN